MEGGMEGGAASDVRHVCTFAVLRTTRECEFEWGVHAEEKGQNGAHQGGHSPTGERRTGSAMSLSSCEWGRVARLRIGVVSGDQMQLTTEDSHRLESRGQASWHVPGVYSPVLEFALVARGSGHGVKDL